MTFKRKHFVRTKIEIDGSILDQVKQFNYFGCELSLDSEPDFDKKNKQIPKNMRHCQKTFGDRGGTLVKVLRYKSEGRWIDPR